MTTPRTAERAIAADPAFLSSPASAERAQLDHQQLVSSLEGQKRKAHRLMKVELGAFVVVLLSYLAPVFLGTSGMVVPMSAMMLFAALMVWCLLLDRQRKMTEIAAHNLEPVAPENEAEAAWLLEHVVAAEPLRKHLQSASRALLNGELRALRAAYRGQAAAELAVQTADQTCATKGERRPPINSLNNS